MASELQSQPGEQVHDDLPTHEPRLVGGRPAVKLPGAVREGHRWAARRNQGLAALVEGAGVEDDDPVDEPDEPLLDADEPDESEDDDDEDESDDDVLDESLDPLEEPSPFDELAFVALDLPRLSVL